MISIFLISAYCLMSCHHNNSNPYWKAYHKAAALAHQNDIALAKEGFICEAVGDGNAEIIRGISRGYALRRTKPVTIDEARMLMVDLVERFSKPFNDEVSIRPYLRSYPFGTESLDLYIAFVDQKGEYFVTTPGIALVGNYEGRVRYFVRESGLLKGVHFESYETALEVVRAQQKKQNKEQADTPE